MRIKRKHAAVVAGICGGCLFAGLAGAGPDAYEADNTAGLARNAASGVTQYRSIHRAGDTDWVKVRIGGSGAKYLKVETGGTTNGNTVVWLYRGDGRLLAFDDDSGRDQYSRIATGYLPPRTYYVKVQEHGQDAAIPFYMLRATWKTVTAAPDRYESDNVMRAARLIGNGETQTRSIHRPGNVDWAKIRIRGTGAKNFRVETAGPSGYDTQMWLCKTDGTVLAYDNNSGRRNFSRITRSSLPRGTYMVKVQEKANNGLIPAYALKATWQTVTVAPDRYESDNVMRAARLIGNGETQTRSIHWAGNVDWAKIRIKGTGAKNIRIETAGPSGYDTQMWLCKTDGTVLAYDNNSGIRNFSRITRSSLPRGTYLVKVQEKANNGWIPAYTLKATWTVTTGVSRVGLGQVATWAYNIQHVDTARQRNELVGTHFDLYVLEPVVTEAGMGGFDIAGLVRDIRNHNLNVRGRNPLVLAYIDIGQAEEWRWYWRSGWGVGHPEWIVAGDPNGWDDCYPVAFWHPEWKDIVIHGSGGMSHVEAALQAGFDGIYMDWVEAFSDEDVIAAAAGTTNTADAMFSFIEEIRRYARVTSPNANPAFLVVAQNASDLYQENPARYEAAIDAIALEAIWYDGDGGFDDWTDPTGYNVLTDDIYPGWTGEVLSHLEPMKGRLPIFCAEYAQDVGGAAKASQVYNVLAPRHGFIPYCTRRSLGRLSTTPYPRGYTPIDY